MIFDDDNFYDPMHDLIQVSATASTATLSDRPRITRRKPAQARRDGSVKHWHHRRSRRLFDEEHARIVEAKAPVVLPDDRVVFITLPATTSDDIEPFSSDSFEL